MVTSKRLDKLSAVLLDLDGTLVETLSLLRDVYYALLREYGVNGSDDEFEKLNGPSLQQAALQLKITHQLACDESVLYGRYLQLLEQSYQQAPAVAGAAELLTYLQGKEIHMALVTSAPHKHAHAILQHHGWQNYFKVVITADDVNYTKPHPEPYQLALTRLKIEPTGAMALEDSVNGVMAAKAAGLEVLSRSSACSEMQDALIAAGANRVFGDLIQVERYLREEHQ